MARVHSRVKDPARVTPSLLTRTPAAPGARAADSASVWVSSSDTELACADITSCVF